MNRIGFEASLRSQEPPADFSPLLQSLWWDAKGDWALAHTIAQGVEGEQGAWVHAYLHRREGDIAHAGCWYRRARRPVCRDPLDSERKAIAEALLAREGVKPTGD